MSITPLNPTVESFLSNGKAILAEHGENETALDLFAGRKNTATRTVPKKN